MLIVFVLKYSTRLYQNLLLPSHFPLNSFSCFLSYLPFDSLRSYHFFTHFFSCSLPSDRHHLSRDDCLEDKRKDYQNCSVLYCVPQHYCTHMSSSYRCTTMDCWWFRFTVLCFTYLEARASLFILCFFLFIFSCLFCVVSTSASDCLQRLSPKLRIMCWLSIV